VALCQVRRFNVAKMKNIISILFIVLITFLLDPIWDRLSTNDDINIRRFCAYGHIYVEFEHNGKVWGTTLISNDGRPLSCTEDETVVPATNKGII
jgi:hypothetical protein